MKVERMLVGLCVLALLGMGCAGKKREAATPERPSTEEAEPVDAPPEQSFENLCGISVTSAPSGATILVDGKEVGQSPITVDKLSVGTYDVTFIYDFGERVTLTVELLAEGEYRNVHHAHAPDASDARLPEKPK